MSIDVAREQSSPMLNPARVSHAAWRIYEVIDCAAPCYGTRYALALAGTKHENLENEQVECSLEDRDAVIGIGSGRHPTQEWHRLGRMSTRTGK